MFTTNPGKTWSEIVEPSPYTYEVSAYGNFFCLMVCDNRLQDGKSGARSFRQSPVKSAFVESDTINRGEYLGIAVGSPADAVYSITEDYRGKGLMDYISPVNNYFADLSDIRKRLPEFDYLVLDEEFDTDTGVQLMLESGEVKRITLNNRSELHQWPAEAVPAQAILIGDGPDVLYKKLLALHRQRGYAHKFERIVLLSRYSFALYDPEKAKIPWRLNYKGQSDLREEIAVHFNGGKVDYLVVTRYKKD